MREEYDFTNGSRGLFYPGNQRVDRERGERVTVLSRGRDEQGAYARIQRGDGTIERVHPSSLRPLNWLEELNDAMARKAGRR